MSKHNSSHFFIENWQCFIDFYVFWGAENQQKHQDINIKINWCFCSSTKSHWWPLGCSDATSILPGIAWYGCTYDTRTSPKVKFWYMLYPPSILLVGVFFKHELYFSIYWECHHPNWLIFSRGVETTNQLWCSNRHGVKQQEWRNKQLHDTVQWHWGSHRVWQLSLRIWCSYRRFWPWSIVPAKVY